MLADKGCFYFRASKFCQGHCHLLKYCRQCHNKTDGILIKKTQTNFSFYILYLLKNIVEKQRDTRIETLQVISFTFSKKFRICIQLLFANKNNFSILFLFSFILTLPQLAKQALTICTALIDGSKKIE